MAGEVVTVGNVRIVSVSDGHGDMNPTEAFPASDEPVWRSERAEILGGSAAAFVSAARVGRLATSSADGAPHLVPVCFALMDGRVYIGLDSKPKSVGALRLRRVRNILENPKVAFLVDVYDDEDWSRLGFALVSGEATLNVPEGERRGAIAALRAKYPQYARMLADGAPVIRITPTAVSSWGDLSG